MFCKMMKYFNNNNNNNNNYNINNKNNNKLNPFLRRFIRKDRKI